MMLMGMHYTCRIRLQRELRPFAKYISYGVRSQLLVSIGKAMRRPQVWSGQQNRLHASVFSKEDSFSIIARSVAGRATKVELLDPC